MNIGHRTLYNFGRTTGRLWILNKEVLYALFYFRSTVGESWDQKLDSVQWPLLRTYNPFSQFPLRLNIRLTQIKCTIAISLNQVLIVFNCLAEVAITKFQMYKSNLWNVSKWAPWAKGHAPLLITKAFSLLCMPTCNSFQTFAISVIYFTTIFACNMSQLP